MLPLQSLILLWTLARELTNSLFLSRAAFQALTVSTKLTLTDESYENKIQYAYDINWDDPKANNTKTVEGKLSTQMTYGHWWESSE